MIYFSQLSKPFYKPSEVSNLLNISTRTLINYGNSGKIDFETSSSNFRLYSKQNIIDFAIANNIFIDDSFNDKLDIIYARVSTNKQKKSGDLDRQISSIKENIVFLNPKNLTVISDVDSGLNDNRKGLNQLLDLVFSNKVDRVFVSYKDRLTRFGLNYLLKIFKQFDVELIIISNENYEKSTQEELAEDIISIIHSFSGKMYGLRKKIKDEVVKYL